MNINNMSDSSIVSYFADPIINKEGKVYKLYVIEQIRQNINQNRLFNTKVAVFGDSTNDDAIENIRLGAIAIFKNGIKKLRHKYSVDNGCLVPKRVSIRKKRNPSLLNELLNILQPYWQEDNHIFEEFEKRLTQEDIEKEKKSTESKHPTYKHTTNELLENRTKSHIYNKRKSNLKIKGKIEIRKNPETCQQEIRKVI